MKLVSLAGIGVYTPTTDQDHELWQRLAAFVSDEPRAFERDPAIGGHVTASAFVLSPDQSSVLLTHHRKLDMWIQLGGHCDGIADAGFVALKEAYEESGLSRINRLQSTVLDVDIHRIPAHKSDPAHLHYDVRFLFQAEAGDVAVSDESHDLAWVPLHEVEAKTQEVSLLRMRDKARAFLDQA